MSTGNSPKNRDAFATPPLQLEKNDRAEQFAGACEKPIKSYVARIEVFADGRRVESPVEPREVAEIQDRQLDNLEVVRNEIKDETDFKMLKLGMRLPNSVLRRKFCDQAMTALMADADGIEPWYLRHAVPAATKWDVSQWLSGAVQIDFLIRTGAPTRPSYRLADGFSAKLKTATLINIDGNTY